MAATRAARRWRPAPPHGAGADGRCSPASAACEPPLTGFSDRSATGWRAHADAATLVLDRVQDAGNVGSMLRSAAAFGVRQVVALKGTAAL
jgi:TrmH family RNA methyltransferase